MSFCITYTGTLRRGKETGNLMILYSGKKKLLVLK